MCEKLAKRLQDEFNLSVKAEDFYRTYAGIHIRRAGAFLWQFVNTGDIAVVGGCDPATECVKPKNHLAVVKRRFNEYEVYVYEPNDIGYNECCGKIEDESWMDR